MLDLLPNELIAEIYKWLAIDQIALSRTAKRYICIYRGLMKNVKYNYKQHINYRIRSLRMHILEIQNHPGYVLDTVIHCLYNRLYYWEKKIG